MPKQSILMVTGQASLRNWIFLFKPRKQTSNRQPPDEARADHPHYADALQ